MENITKNILMLVAVISVIYSVLNRDIPNNPVDECYQYLWGNAVNLEILGLDELGAQEVHEVCRDIVIESLAYSDNNELRQPVKLIVDDLVLEQIEQGIESTDFAPTLYEPAFAPNQADEHYTLERQENP